MLGIAVVGLFVGTRVVGDSVGFLVGLFVVGLEVGVLVGFRVVGVAVVGLEVGTLVGFGVVGIPVGLFVGVGLLVVGGVVGGPVVGLEVHPTISVGGMHTLLTVSQLFWVQTMPSLQPESLMHCSSPGHMNPVFEAGPSSRYTITLAMSRVPAVVLQSLMTSHLLPPLNFSLRKMGY